MKKTEKMNTNNDALSSDAAGILFSDAIASVKANAKEAIANEKARADEAEQLVVKAKSDTVDNVLEVKAEGLEKEKNYEATIARLKTEAKEKEKACDRRIAQAKAKIAKIKVEHKEHIKKLKAVTQEAAAQIRSEIEKTIVRQEARVVKTEKLIAKARTRYHESVAEIKAEAHQKEDAYDHQMATTKIEHEEAMSDIKSEHKETIADIKTGHKEAIAQSKAEHEEQVAKLKSETELASGAVSQAIRKMVDSPAVLPGQQSLAALDLCAEDIMQKDVVWANPDDTIQRTLIEMQKYTTDYVLVGDGSTLTGMVSRADLSASISPYLRPAFAKCRRPLDDATLQIKLSLIMSRPVHTIGPQMSLEAVIRNMCRCRSRCLPVVDQQGKVLGLVTEVNIFKSLLKVKNAVETCDSDETSPATTRTSVSSLPHQSLSHKDNENPSPIILAT